LDDLAEVLGDLFGVINDNVDVLDNFLLGIVNVFDNLVFAKNLLAVLLDNTDGVLEDFNSLVAFGNSDLGIFVFGQLGSMFNDLLDF